MSNYREYKLFNLLESSSSTKRMSVIVRDEAAQIFLFCKGAEVSLQIVEFRLTVQFIQLNPTVHVYLYSINMILILLIYVI